MKVERSKWLGALALLLGLFILASGAFFLLNVRQLGRAMPPAGPATPATLQWPAARSAVSPDLWQVFQGGSATPAANTSDSLASRFRLAGTFFVQSDLSSSGETAPHKAILDDLRKNEQYIVGEGDKVDDYEVARVYDDHVTIRHDGTDSDLYLSFAGGPAAVGEATAANGAGPDNQPLQDVTRFGGRVGFNRWVFKRDELLKYYQELMDDPERLASLFVSLKPSYTENQISGYFLQSEGEADFFRAMGLKEGDVIRKVNSMNMTSQRRAEYMIGEFVENRLNAFVLDIEREGKPEKLIYLLR